MIVFVVSNKMGGNCIQHLLLALRRNGKKFWGNSPIRLRITHCQWLKASLGLPLHVSMYRSFVTVSLSSVLPLISQSFETQRVGQRRWRFRGFRLRALMTKGRILQFNWSTEYSVLPKINSAGKPLAPADRVNGHVRWSKGAQVGLLVPGWLFCFCTGLHCTHREREREGERERDVS